MRSLGLLLLAFPLLGQPAPPSRTSMYTYDANGQRILAGQQVSSAGGSEQLIRNMNGRVSPLERIEEKVISDNGVERVIERTIHPYDTGGSAQTGQRIRITERKEPGGTKTIDTEVYQGNINGGFSLSERSHATERKENGRLLVETQIERVTINGSLETVEKKASTSVTSGTKTAEDTLVYRKDTSGNFYAAARSIKEVDKKEGGSVENTTNYAAGAQGLMELVGQLVTESRRANDGSEVRETSIYGTGAPGRPTTGKLALREKQIVERNRTATGAVETFSIQRPALDNPHALSAPQKISEKVCKGPCQ